MKPKVAFIGTGGTIASVGAGPLDTLDYGATGIRLHADEIIARVPETALVADVIPVRFRDVPSPGIFFDDWKEIARRCDALVAEHPDLAGIVVGHGTASLEETAYALHLVLKVSIPVVVVGSQRPMGALSSDAGMNLVNAIRVAGDLASHGRGVMVLLNDEIHCAREVTKTSTFRLQTFRAPDFGVLGYADGDRIVFYRSPERRHMPGTEFDIRTLDALPRVDIVYAYTGSDGTAVRAFVQAGARGLISAGFAPGFPSPADSDALQAARKAGVTVVLSTRAGSGRVFRGTRARSMEFLTADNLNPQKARILLALALTVTTDPERIADIFDTY